MRRVGLLAALTVGLAALGAGVAAPAAAEPPSRLADQLTDSAGVLDAGQEREVTGALDELAQRAGVQLFVTFVDSFDGAARQEWIDETARLSGLGTEDYLLAVAVQDREYGWTVAPDARISDAELGAVARERIEPALAEDDWAGAAAAAADGYGDALTGESAGSGSGSGVGGAAVLVLLGVLALAAAAWLGVRALRRRSAERRHREQAVASLDALRAEANRVLVATDDAVRRSEQELGFAQAEFAAERTASFEQALASAREALAEAFALRQQVEDDHPESDADRRAMLDRLVARCRAADEALDAESERFDALRDLVATAPQRLEAVLVQAEELERALPAAERTLAGLRQRYAERALSGVAGNPEEARARLDLARRTVQSGREALQRRSGRGAAADAVRAAEEALGQARRLLDGVARAGRDLDDAVARLPAVLSDARADLAAAQAEVDAEPGLAAPVARARAALAEAEQGAHADPLGSLHRVVEADAELDQALQRSRQAREGRRRAEQALAQALVAARAEVEAAEDYVATRRGAVGGDARTSLAEARRHLAAAEAGRDTDPAAALQEARTADRLAQQARRLALADLQGWQDGGWGPGSGRGRAGTDPTALLGGILLGHVLGGGHRRRGPGGFGGFGGGIAGGRRGGGGGFGGGGFGGGGFGGGGRGGGGRF